MTWRRTVGVWLGGAIIGLASCGGPTFIVQQYSGPPRPKDAIAIVRVNAGGPELFLVDGERLRAAPEKGTRLHIEMMPGVHEVGVVAPDLGLTQGVTVRFVADAGKVYRMVVHAAPAFGNAASPGFTAHAYEVDRGTDAELGPAADAPPDTAPPRATPNDETPTP